MRMTRKLIIDFFDETTTETLGFLQNSEQFYSIVKIVLVDLLLMKN
jgi:hypothetical protein